MQLSVDQKIQLAIQPLIERITALEAENEKFKQEIAALHTATQPKTAHKPGVKPPAEPVERPQTVKGGRKKSVDNHEVKPDTKTDKKPVPKKQEPKGQGEEVKPENPKHVGTKTPVVNGKGIASPALPKDQNPANKDVKPKPGTAGGHRVSGTNINNKSIIVDKKTTTKSIETEEKKEGEQHHEQKKEHGSHEKPEHGKPTHNPKTPAATKKPVQVKKPAPAPVPTTNKKGGKGPAKPADTKTESPKEEPKEQKQEPKEQVKEQVKEEVKEEVKEQVKQEHKEPTDEAKQQAKEEQVLLQDHEVAENGEQVYVQKTEEAPVVQAEQSAPAADDEAL